MRDACADFGCHLAEVNGGSSHVRLLVNFPPKIALSRLVNSLKRVSSRRVRQEFPGLRHYWRTNRLWSGSYFAESAGGAPITVLPQYIEQQNPPAWHGRGRAAFTTDLKAGALTAILVAQGGQAVGEPVDPGVELGVRPPPRAVADGQLARPGGGGPRQRVADVDPLDQVARCPRAADRP